MEASIIVVAVHRFSPEFFDLSNRQAGHFFQKMQNYRMRLIVLGDISGPMARSKALSDFVGEINRVGYHLFATERADMRRGWPGDAKSESTRQQHPMIKPL